MIEKLIKRIFKRVSEEEKLMRAIEKDDYKKVIELL